MALKIVEYDKSHKHVLGMPSKQVMNDLAAGFCQLLFIYVPEGKGRGLRTGFVLL